MWCWCGAEMCWRARLQTRGSDRVRRSPPVQPSFKVSVAGLEVGELLVRHGDLGGVADGDEVDGDEGVGCGAALPLPGEGELFGRDDFLVGADDGVDVAAAVMYLQPIGAADAEVDLGFGGVLISPTLNQRASWLGSVQALKTLSRGAAKVRVTTSGGGVACETTVGGAMVCDMDRVPPVGAG